MHVTLLEGSLFRSFCWMCWWNSPWVGNPNFEMARATCVEPTPPDFAGLNSSVCLVKIDTYYFLVLNCLDLAYIPRSDVWSSISAWKLHSCWFSHRIRANLRDPALNRYIMIYPPIKNKPTLQGLPKRRSGMVIPTWSWRWGPFFWTRAAWGKPEMGRDNLANHVKLTQFWRINLNTCLNRTHVWYLGWLIYRIRGFTALLFTYMMWYLLGIWGTVKPVDLLRSDCLVQEWIKPI